MALATSSAKVQPPTPEQPRSPSLCKPAPVRHFFYIHTSGHKIEKKKIDMYTDAHLFSVERSCPVSCSPMVSGLHSEAQGAFSDDANSKRACQTGCHQEQIVGLDHSTFQFISVAFANSVCWPGRCGHQLLNVVQFSPDRAD